MFAKDQRIVSNKYRNNYDRIFRSKEKLKEQKESNESTYSPK